MWIDDYVKLHFPTNPEDMRIEEAQMLKFKHMPTALYRYREFNEYTIENLIKEQEWQSYPCEFNDPFDSRIKIDFDKVKKDYFFENIFKEFINKMEGKGRSFTKEEIKDIRSSDNPCYALAKYAAKLDPELTDKKEDFAKVITELMNEHLKEMYEPILNSFQNGYLIVCFSEVKDSILMWSHYAKNHTGFCIEYNFKELGPKSPLTRMLVPVIYTDDLFDATQYLLNPIIEGHRLNNLFGIYPSITKGTEWEYESEWRTVFPLGPDADREQRFLKVPTPKALYVGFKASQQNIEKLKEIAVTKNIPLYQMNLSDDSRELFETIIYSPAELNK